MNFDSKDILDAIGKAHKVDTIEKMFWDFKQSIKQDLTAIAQKQQNDLTTSIQAANQLQIEQFKNVITDAISSNNEKNLKPLREDIATIKSDKKAIKWVAATISSAIAFIGTVAGYFVTK